eukprot:1043339_1
MNGRICNTVLRIVPRRSSHTSSPFRLSPSNSSSTHRTSEALLNPPPSLSSRALSSAVRSRTSQSTLRAALACEASSLRYALLLEGEGEEALLRGWDDGVVEDEDGT